MTIEDASSFSNPCLHCFFNNSHRVPLGFVCGYPVGNGGEQYGGSMFIKSAAADTLQGKAIQAVNEKWGDANNSDARRQWGGRETIGIPVCKKKYSPFAFSPFPFPPFWGADVLKPGEKPPDVIFLRLKSVTWAATNGGGNSAGWKTHHKN